MSDRDSRREPGYDYALLDGANLRVSEARPNPVLEKSFAFALSVISLYKELITQHEYVVSKQLLRSGTSIGANVEEATAAESRKDFVHKMAIASKEARETAYWLRLLGASDLVSDLDVTQHLREATELVRLLTAIVKTSSAE